VLLIPGTSSRRHLIENMVASRIRLDADAMQQLSTEVITRPSGGRR